MDRDTAVKECKELFERICDVDGYQEQVLTQTLEIVWNRGYSACIADDIQKLKQELAKAKNENN